MNQRLAPKPGLSAENPRQNRDCGNGRDRNVPCDDSSDDQEEPAEKNEKCRRLSDTTWSESEEEILIDNGKTAELLQKGLQAIVSQNI